MMPNDALKPAIVVSGASSGIGRELARIAAGEGKFLLLVARSRPMLNNLVAELAARSVAAGCVSIDLAAPDAGANVEQALAERGLYCEVLVNAAGHGLYGPSAVLDREQQLSMIDVNARALADLTLRFLPEMIRRHHGGILNVGSLAGHFAGPNMALYYATK